MTTLADETKVGSLVTPDTCDSVTWSKILDARERQAAAQENVDAIKKELREANEDLDECTVQLGKLIDEARYPNLFNQQKPADNGAAATADPSTDDSAWRAVTLAELGIKGKTAELLEAAELPTLGAISDYMKGGAALTAIMNIGEGRAAKLEEAMAVYWEKHPRPTQPEPSDNGKDAPQANSEPARPLPKIVPISDLQLTEDDIRAAYYPKLQSEIENKDFGRITDSDGQPKWIVLEEGQYVAVPGAIDGAHYTLIPVYDAGTTFEDDGSPFTGKPIGTDKPHWILGPVSEHIHLRVNGKEVQASKVA